MNIELMREKKKRIILFIFHRSNKSGVGIL